MERILKNKKAHGLDTILAIASIFGLALVCLIGVYTYSEFVSHAKNATAINQTPQAIAAMEDMETVNEMWDYFILVVFIGFAIAMMVLGYFIDVHTVFFPLFVIVMLIGVLIASVLSYVWGYIADTSIFIEITSSTFPITTHLMNNLIVYYIVIAGMALITTYAKTKESV